MFGLLLRKSSKRKIKYEKKNEVTESAVRSEHGNKIKNIKNGSFL